MEPRFLGPAHADRLAALHADGFDAPWDAAEFAALLDQPGVFAIALGEAFVLCRVVADEAEILTIAVRPSSRRRGLGRNLMDEALRRLYRDRVASCFLEVDPDNGSAIALYRSLGFAVVGERKGYYRRAAGSAAAAPALVMRVQLR